MNNIKSIYFLFLFIALVGCAARQNASSGRSADDGSMIRLERDVEELCGDLVKGVKPGNVFITWYDNLHPNSPLLLEEYIVSMFQRDLIRRGYPISTNEKSAVYKLMLTMTPSPKSLLVLASAWRGDVILATREAHFTNGTEKWSKALCSYRLRTKTTIHIGSTP